MMPGAIWGGADLSDLGLDHRRHRLTGTSEVRLLSLDFQPLPIRIRSVRIQMDIFVEHADAA